MIEGFKPGTQWPKKRKPTPGRAGENHGKAILTWKKVRAIRELLKRGYTEKRLGKRFKTHPNNIGRVKRLETWNNG